MVSFRPSVLRVGLLGGLLCLSLTGMVDAAPKIECASPKYHFGTQIAGEPVVHEFVLVNQGDEPLEIIKIKDCCGVKSSVSPSIIPPGSNAVCRSVFTTKNRDGEQEKQILLVTNDKKHLYFDLRLTGTLIKPVEFSPRFIRLGDLLTDSLVEVSITATNLLDQSVTLDSAKSGVKGLAAEVIQSDDRSWVIKVVSSLPLAEGKLSGQITLNFSSGTVNVPVIGVVGPIIQATPQSITFNSPASGTVERFVMLRSGDGRPFEVLTSRLEKAEGEIEASKLSDGKWRIRLLVNPASIQSSASLQLTTSIDSCETIEIRLGSK